MVQFKVKRIDPEAKVPSKAHADDAGIDVYANEQRTLQPGERYTFSTGIAVEFPPGYVALFRDRSSLGAQGIHSLAGVIDANYRGQWKVVLLNTGSEPYTVLKGDKIVQCVFQKYEHVDIVEVDDLSDTPRNDGGFGSTGQ